MLTEEDPSNNEMDDLPILRRYAIVLAIAGAFFVLLLGIAMAHEARTVAGQPLGWSWDPLCCGGRDCSIIPNSAVVEGPDGYRVTLKAGEHPMLKTKGYSAIIPYGSEKTSPTGEYGICLSSEGAHRFCFYAGGKNY